MKAKYNKMTKAVLVDEIADRDDLITDLQNSMLSVIDESDNKKCGVWTFFKWLIAIVVTVLVLLFATGFIAGAIEGLGKTEGYCVSDVHQEPVACFYMTFDEKAYE